MDKLILIDDDAILRRAISQAIDWPKYGIELCGAARDAIEGMELIARCEPDVVVTDIRMPQISGIELCSILNREYPGIKTILLSGHEEFEYAKKAIDSRVFAYLTKPVKNDKLVEIIQRAISEKHRESERQQLLDAGMPLVRSQIFREAFNSNLPYEKMLSFLQLLGIQEWTHCSAAVFRLNKENNEATNVFAAEVFKSLFENQTLIGDAQLVDLDTDRFAAVVFGNQEDIQLKLQTMAQRLTDYFSTDVRFRLCGVIGSPHPAGPMALHNAYAEASSVSVWRHITSANSILFADDYTQTDSDDETILSEHLHQSMKQLAATLLAENTNWEEALDNCCTEAHQNHLSTRAVQLNAIRFLNRLNDRSPSSFDATELESHQFFIMSQSKTSPIFERIREICSAFRKGMELSRRTRSQVLADKALAYLHMHYNDPELSLATLANELDVSYTYLSQLFANEVGQNFQPCLQSIRMEKAKELLAVDDVKSYEAAEKVGFSNAYYFGACFKKYTGMTVSEYKKKLHP